MPRPGGCRLRYGLINADEPFCHRVTISHDSWRNSDAITCRHVAGEHPGHVSFAD